MTTTSNVDPSPDEGSRQPPQLHQEHHEHHEHHENHEHHEHQQSNIFTATTNNNNISISNSISNNNTALVIQQTHHQHRQRKHQPPPQWPITSDSLTPDDELDFHVQAGQRPPQKTRPPPVNRASVLGVRRMSSVPELGQTQRGGRPGRSQSRRVNSKIWADGGRTHPYEPVQGGADRLIRQKSIERGIVGVVSPPPRPSPQGARRAASNGAAGSRRPGSRPTSRNGALPHQQHMAQRAAPPPGLKMPLAFNSIARDRGFTTGTQPQQQQQPPHARNKAPTPTPTDLYENRQQRYRDPPRSAPFPNQASFSLPASTNTSPHNSFVPPSYADEEFRSFRSGPSTSDQNRSSSYSEEQTDTSNAMTVDEAIGMYGSDTDEEEMYTSGQESEHRRSKGDSVLGGSRSRQGSYSDSVFRNKGDSVLGDDSPGSRSRNSDQEDRLQGELDRQERGSSREFDDSSEQKSPVASDTKVRVEVEVEVEAEVEAEASNEVVNSVTGNDEAEASNEVVNSVPGNDDVETVVETATPVFVVPRKPTPPVSVENVEPPPPARDRYGFRKATQYITLKEYEEWEGRYNETLDRRQKKWDQLMRESGLTPGEGGPVRFPPKSAKIKRYIRKGIPPEWRGAAWFWYAGGQRYLNKHAGLYEELVLRGPPPPDSELIERDLHRTFPDNVKFKPDPPAGTVRMSKMQEKQQETAIVQKLRRVLVAFAVYVPRIGYCQSLNFLAGLLLLFMEEEKAFWMLFILTQTHLPGTHEMNLEGSSVDQWVLMTSVRDSLPQIWAKIGGSLDGSEVELESTKLPPVTLCTSSWFMSGFIGSLPIESVLRVWDCLFYEGSKTLFRIALTVFKTGEPQIKAVHDPMEIFQVVQTIPRKLIDAGALVEACYRRRNGFGHLSQEHIDERRQERRNVFAEERALIARGERLSKDDGALRGAFDSTTRGGANSHHHELGRKFRKILVKT